MHGELRIATRDCPTVGGPDRRRQAVPVRDQLPECHVSADIVQPLAPLFDASIMLRNDLRNLGRGCNSRRLHFLCYKPFYHNGLRLRWTRVSFPPPRIFRVVT